MAKRSEKVGKKKPPALRKSLATRAKETEDAAWREWYLKVDQRRRALTDVKRMPLVISSFEKDGEEQRIVRQKSRPIPLKDFVKQSARAEGPRLVDELEQLQSVWGKVAGVEIAGESGVYSFRGGVLIIEVYGSGLLQEIRQFHAQALLKDLRDVWPLPVALVELRFRLGKKR